MFFPVAHITLNCNTVPRSMYPTLEHKVPRNVHGLRGILWYKQDRAWFDRLYGRWSTRESLGVISAYMQTNQALSLIQHYISVIALNQHCVPTRNVSNQDLMGIWRGNQIGRRKHSLSRWNGNGHLSWRVTVLLVGVSPLAIKGSKNWWNVICLCSCRKTLTFVLVS